MGVTLLVLTLNYNQQRLFPLFAGRCIDAMVLSSHGANEVSPEIYPVINRRLTTLRYSMYSWGLHGSQATMTLTYSNQLMTLWIPCWLLDVVSTATTLQLARLLLLSLRHVCEGCTLIKHIHSRARRLKNVRSMLGHHRTFFSSCRRRYEWTCCVESILSFPLRFFLSWFCVSSVFDFVSK